MSNPHAPAPRGYLTPAELAERLTAKPTWLENNLRRLERDLGFPHTAPGMGHRYDPLAVRLWQDRNLPPHLAAAAPRAELTEPAAPALEPLDEDEIAELLDGR